MKTPKYQQLRILRWINGGAELRRQANSQQCEVVINGVVVAIVRPTTITKMVEGGWIALNQARQTWEITTLGRGHAETPAFVRAFSDNPESR